MQRDQQSILDIINSINLILDYTQGIDWEAIEIKNQDAIILAQAVAMPPLDIRCFCIRGQVPLVL